MTRTPVLLLLLFAVTLFSLVVSTFAWQKMRARLLRWEDPPLAARWAGPDDAPRVAFLGASVFESWRLAEAYPEWRTLNAGVGWQFVGQQLLRMRADVLENDVDVVVVECCASNFVRSGKGLLDPLPPERVKESVLSIADVARANGVVPVLCTPLPVSEAYARAHRREDLQGQLLAFRRWMLEEVAPQGILVADLFEALSDEKGHLAEELSPDGLHLRREGYAPLNEALRPVVATALSGNRGT